MKLYDKIQTFTTDDFQKQQLNQLRKNKVNVSKFIRDAVNEKLAKETILKQDKRKKYTMQDLKDSLNASIF
jgi:post-segregation antitoxin (ccd killing protein)